MKRTLAFVRTVDSHGLKARCLLALQEGQIFIATVLQDGLVISFSLGLLTSQPAQERDRMGRSLAWNKSYHSECLWIWEALIPGLRAPLPNSKTEQRSSQVCHSRIQCSFHDKFLLLSLSYSYGCLMSTLWKQTMICVKKGCGSPKAYLGWRQANLSHLKTCEQISGEQK